MKNIILLLSLTFTQFFFAQDYPKTLPDFEINTIESNSFNQNDVTTETYSYFVYFNPNCGHCKTAFKTLNLHVEKLKNAEVKLYPVSAKNQKETQEFFNSFGPKLLGLKNIQILIDDGYKFADAFFVGAYPTSSYLYDKNNLSW